MHNLSRHGEYVKRNLLSVPPNRQYFRNMRSPQNKRNANSQQQIRWQPSCKFLVGICFTIFVIIVMAYMKSMASKYTRRYWKWSVSDEHAKSKYNSMQKSLQKWLKNYPPIKPWRAHKGFTCDLWECKATFDANSNQWIEPRKEYKVLLPDNNAYYDWMDTHNQQNEHLIDPQQNCEYLFIGDSITHSWTYHMDVFNKYFNQNNNGFIYAQSGDKIHEIGWRLGNGEGNGFKYMEQCLLNNKLKKKSMILLIGTNDIGGGQTYDVALTDYIVLLSQLLDFVNKINEKQQTLMLYLIGIFPRDDIYISFKQRKEEDMKEYENWDVDNKYFYSINFINDYLNKFAKANSDIVKFIDCNDYLLENDKNIVEFKDNGGTLHQYETGVMKIEIMEDMLHLSEKGYERWATCIMEQTSGTLSDKTPEN